MLVELTNGGNLVNLLSCQVPIAVISSTEFESGGGQGLENSRVDLIKEDEDSLGGAEVNQGPLGGAVHVVPRGIMWAVHKHHSGIGMGLQIYVPNRKILSTKDSASQGKIKQKNKPF